MKTNAKKWLALLLAAVMALSLLTACGDTNNPQPNGQQTESQQPSDAASTNDGQTDDPGQQTEGQQPTEPDKNDLTVVRSMELQYANNFSVDYCANGCKIITDGAEQKFLWVPEGAEVPDDTGDMTVLQAPLTKLGCFSTTHATLFHAIGALDKVCLVTTAQEKWYIE